MNNALEITGLRKEYRDFSLEDVSFTLPEGYIMGFVGKNGAGKTTTIRLILNMISRNGGTIKVSGRDNIRDEQAIKQDIGVVFDDIFFVENWKISDIENVVKSFYSRWDSELYRKYLKSFGLSVDKKVKDLSRGMKMKLMLAVAMSHEARLLILDEPTSGLDPVARDELLDILSTHISDGYKSILFSTHITSDLEAIADYITLIDNGRIFYTGTKDELLESFRIIKGGVNDLTDQLREKIIGFKQNNTGFSGLISAAEVKQLPVEIVVETPAIDEILVYISKGEGNHD